MKTDTSKGAFQNRSTRFYDGGRTAIVMLRVDRRDYEFARQWAAYHAKAFPQGTAEDQLEGYLNAALLSHVQELNWRAPQEIESLYPTPTISMSAVDDLDDGIPF